MRISDCKGRARCVSTLVVLGIVVPATTALAVDRCEVRLIDTVAAEEALQKGQNPTAAITVLGRFEPVIGEEELTTRHFEIPGTTEYVVASAYYTDEAFVLRRPADDLRHDTSIRLGIVVAGSKLPDAFGVSNNAVAVANTSDELLLVSAMTSVTRQGRRYVIVLDCLLNDAEWDDKQAGPSGPP